MSKIGQKWPKQLFEQSKSSILETLGHTSGIEFTSAKINSIAYHYNRFGSSAILDIQLYDENDPESESNIMSIAVIYKQLAEGVISSKVEKINSEFIQLLESRQNSWIVEKEKLGDTISFKEYPEFPDLIFAPEIVYSDSENNYIGYSTLNRFVRRDKSGVLPLNRYKVMGYALARFHGKKFTSINSDLYSKYFDFLLSHNIDQKTVNGWKNVLKGSKGGTGHKFIFGDYAMECVQYNTISYGSGQLDSLCMIDPVLIEGGDRAEDLASLLASLTKEKLVKYLRTNPEGSLREALTQTLRYLVTQSGKQLIDIYINLIPNFLKNYDSFPLDFFLGFFLLRAASSIKNQAVLDESLRDMLIVLGEQFLSKRPFAEAYQIR